MKLSIWLSVGLLSSGISALVLPNSPRPLVIWHGLGDSYASEGMNDFGELIKEVHPGIFIHSVRINDDNSEDMKAGFYGHVNEQIELVASQLAGIDELQGGFDAIGFSQGGQFLRAYVERHNNPPVHNLITFGSQHMGVSTIPECGKWNFLCQIARRAANSGVYTTWAQTNIVTAQYFRDPERLDTYLEVNKFLTSINNEIPAQVNETYAKNFASLENLVLVLFSNDTTVVPKESSWFGSYAPSEGKEERTMVPMRMQPLYTNDTIGLKALDERGAVKTEICVGRHMQLAHDCWQPLVEEYVGGRVSGASPALRVQI